MIRALWTAATGMGAQVTNLDVIANNIANVNTTGYKKSKAGFQDLLYQTLQAAGSSSGPDTTRPVGQQVGSGTKVASISKEFSQGSMINTSRELDVAIAGTGFFPVTAIDGTTAYSRDGSFKLTNNGNIVTSDGLAILGIGSVPSNARAINIGPTGQVSFIDQNGNENNVGQIQLAMFTNPSGLDAAGNNLFRQSSASGDAILVTPGLESSGTLQQHYLEGSNVSIVEEMVNMITAQRAYETNSKAIQAADQMLAVANQIAR